MLPINVDDLVHCRTIESARVEFNLTDPPRETILFGGLVWSVNLLVVCRLRLRVGLLPHDMRIPRSHMLGRLPP